MPRRGGVEDDVIVVREEPRVREHACELIERRYLNRAGSGELLLHAPHHALGQHTAVRTHYPFAVSRRGLLRVQVHQA